MPSTVTFTDNVACDEDVQTLAELTAQEIINGAHQKGYVCGKEDDDGFDVLEENDAPSNTEDVSSIATLHANRGRCPNVPD